MRGSHLLLSLGAVLALVSCSGMAGGGAAPGSENLVTDHSVGGLQNGAMPGQTSGAVAPDPDRGEKAFACDIRVENVATPEEKAAGIAHFRGQIPCSDEEGGSVCFSGRVLRLVNHVAANYLDAVSQGAPGEEANVEWKWSLGSADQTPLSVDDVNFYIAPTSEANVANPSLQSCSGLGRCAPKDWLSVSIAKEGEGQAQAPARFPGILGPTSTVPKDAPVVTGTSVQIKRPSKD